MSLDRLLLHGEEKAESGMELPYPLRPLRLLLVN